LILYKTLGYKNTLVMWKYCPLNDTGENANILFSVSCCHNHMSHLYTCFNFNFAYLIQILPIHKEWGFLFLWAEQPHIVQQVQDCMLFLQWHQNPLVPQKHHRLGSLKPLVLPPLGQMSSLQLENFLNFHLKKTKQNITEHVAITRHVSGHPNLCM